MCVYMCIYSVCKLFYMHVHVCVLRIRTYHLVATDKFCAVTYRQPLQSYDILNFLTWYVPVTYIRTYIAPMHTCHVIIFRKFLQKSQFSNILYVYTYILWFSGHLKICLPKMYGVSYVHLEFKLAYFGVSKLLSHLLVGH